MSQFDLDYSTWSELNWFTSRAMTSMWANFAKMADPTPPGLTYLCHIIIIFSWPAPARLTSRNDLGACGPGGPEVPWDWEPAADDKGPLVRRQDGLLGQHYCWPEIKLNKLRIFLVEYCCCKTLFFFLVKWGSLLYCSLKSFEYRHVCVANFICNAPEVSDERGRHSDKILWCQFQFPFLQGLLKI